MQKNIPPIKHFMLIIWFIAGLAMSGYIAIKLYDVKWISFVAAIIISFAYWTGYGTWHHKLFKNTKFDRPVESLKGFLFFLLFLSIFLITFGKYFLPFYFK